MPTIDWHETAQEWVGRVTARARDAWNKLDGRKQYLVVQVLQDIARLRAVELAGGAPVAEELKIAEATLRNLGVVASLIVARTVMDVLNDSLKMAGSILTGLLGGIKF